MWRFFIKLRKGNSRNSDFGLISRGIEVSGEVMFTDRLNVEGKITGRLTSDSGILVIEETGQVEAQVDVGVCVIRGSLQGDLVAKSRTEIHRTGRVQGDVMTPVLLVEEGAVFNGAVKMSQDAGGRLLGELLSEQADGTRKIKSV